MADLIVNLIPGGWLTALGGLVALVAGLVTAAYRRGRKIERNAHRAEEADAYEKHLRDIAEAGNAGNRVRPGDSLSDDPYNRD